MHLTGPDLEVEPVDRTHSAEAQRHLIQRQSAGIGRRAEQRFEQFGPRDDGAVALERAAVLEIQDLGNSAGDREHDDEQQYRIEKCRPRDQGCGKFRQHGQENGAEQRAENRAAAADQDGDEEQDRQVERERVRRDVGLQRGEQPAGNCGDGAAEQEHRPQQSGLGDAAGFCRDFGIADRGERAAEPACRDIRRHPGADRGEAEAEIIEAPLGGERFREDRSGNADAAAGHALPGQRHLGHDGGEAKRRDGEIEGAQPQRRQADDQAEDGADHGRNRQRQIGRQCRRDVAGHQNAGGVGAERQQRHPADRDLAAEPDDQIEAGHQHPIDAGAGRDHAPIAAAEQRERMPTSSSARNGSVALECLVEPSTFGWLGRNCVACVSIKRVVGKLRRRGPRGAPAGR